jgi:hypothetical protein
MIWHCIASIQGTGHPQSAHTCIERLVVADLKKTTIQMSSGGQVQDGVYDVPVQERRAWEAPVLRLHGVQLRQLCQSHLLEGGRPAGGSLCAYMCKFILQIKFRQSNCCFYLFLPKKEAQIWSILRC